MHLHVGSIVVLKLLNFSCKQSDISEVDMSVKTPSSNTVITETDVREYFRETLANAIVNQHVEAEEETVFYIVNMLANFSRADRLFEDGGDGPVLKPLALIYARAVQSGSAEERQRSLQYLGDVALLISGLFPDSLSRKLVDVDYYIAMGRSAYGCLSDTAKDSIRVRALAAIFSELSAKFQMFVDVLSEVGEQSRLGSCHDLMRLYEIWARTGSPRVAGKLRRLGVEPVPSPYGQRRN